MQRKEQIVILLFILVISIFTAVSFCNKLHRKVSYLIPEESLKSTYAQQAIQEKKIVDLNNASRYDLAKLPGIGPKTAQRIVDYRDKNNGFTSKDQLLDVKGIGTKKYDAIKKRIEVNIAG